MASSRDTQLRNKHVVVIGGTSGIGLAIARSAIDEGATTTIGGSSRARLDAALAMLGGRVIGRSIDLADVESMERFCRDLDRVDHLVVTSQSGTAVQTLKPLSSLDFGAMESAFRVKLFGTLRFLRAVLPNFAPDGSIVLFSGAASRRTIPGHVALGAVNGAVEAAGRQLAKELAPIRVNVVSPGLVRTSAYDPMDEKTREAMFLARAKALPVGRVGRPEDIAQAVLQLLVNGYMTGVVLDIDGGALLG